MMRTFPIGGVHPSDNKKWSSNSAIEQMDLPDVVNVPLSQHIGAPATPKVAKGDKVRVGDLIAEATGFMSANIHAPVSGTVTAVDMQPNGQGLRQMMITIRREGDEWAEGIDRSDTIVENCELTSREIIDRIKAAGIVGMGGATFPTHVKLSIPDGKHAEALIINGVECEPYLTSDYRTMLERGRELIIGTKILMRAVNVGKAYIGVESNKPDAIKHLRSLLDGTEGISVVKLKTKAVVCNASTAVAVYEAVQKNKPLVERVVTVTGKHMREPKNLLARFGTPVEALVAKCGGLPEGDVRVLNGGPMMGRPLVNLGMPVMKGCSGIVVMSGADALRGRESACIKCAKCVEACPMGLEPYLLSKLSRRKDWESVERGDVVSCIECGSCQYTCPANIPLLDYIRLGKQTVMGIIRARNAKK